MTEINRMALVLFFCFAMPNAGSAERANIDFLKTLERLANSVGLEAVYDDRFPIINPYDSFGSPYVLDIFETKERNVFFLARKRNKTKESQITNNPSLRLIRLYDYHLIFARIEEGDDDYKIKNIIENVGLKGMTLFYGNMDIFSRSYKYVHSDEIIDGVNLDISKLSMPIIISALSSTAILFYYDGHWIEYVERDW